MSFFGELRRRNVFRVGIAYLAAVWGFWTGTILFILIHGEILSGEWLAGTRLAGFGEWFDFNAPGPYSAATLAGLTAVLVTVLVSRVTERLPAAHLAKVLGESGWRTSVRTLHCSLLRLCNIAINFRQYDSGAVLL